MTKRQIIILSVPIGILLAGYGLKQLLAAQKKNPDKKPVIENKKYVSVSPIKYQKTAIIVEGYGRLQTAEAINLVAEVSGRLMPGAVPMKPSSSFRKGQLLYKIDDREAALALKAQKSDFISQLVATLPDIQLDYPESFETWNEWRKKLQPSQRFPELPEDQDQGVIGLLTARRIFATYYQIRSTEERLSKYTYYAPFDGTFTTINVETGSVVNVNANIGRIINSNTYEVAMPVPQESGYGIKKGMQVSLTSSDNQINVKGEISRISDYVDPATQSLLVFIRVAGNDRRLYDGLFLKGEIRTGIVEPLMALPRKALLPNNQAFLVEDSTLQVQTIQLRMSDERFVYFNGPKEGQLLVVESVVGGMPNMKVNPTTVP